MVEYLITGCGGFVGTHYLSYLQDRNFKGEIVGIGTSPPLRRPAQLKYSFETLNLLNANRLEQVIKKYKPRFCVHLASMSSVALSWVNPNQSFTNNTNVFLNLVEAIRKYSPETRILSVGSSEQYGPGIVEGVLYAESDRLVPENPYSVARCAQEQLARVYIAGFGLDIVMTRSFNHIGPGQRERFVISRFCRLFAKALDDGAAFLVMPTGDLQVTRDFLDVRDVVVAYDAILHRADTGSVYNVCSGRGVLLFDVVNQLSEMSGVHFRTRIDESLLRPIENRMIVGSRKLLTTAFGWEPTIPLVISLSDMLRYWRTR